MSQYEDYLQKLMLANPAAGTVSPTTYAAARTPLENQFKVAQGQLQSSLPAGGQLNSALANLILQRGQAVGGLDAQLLNQSQNRAMQTGALAGNMRNADLQRALQTSVQDKNLAWQREQYGRNKKSQNWAGLGTGLGILAGLGLGLAEE